MIDNARSHGIILLALTWLFASQALALGEMDGAYFEVKYKSKGITYDETGVLENNAKSKGTCYTKLIYLEGGYIGPIACETAPGVWELTENGFELFELADSSALGNDNHIYLTNNEGHFVNGYTTSIWVPKLNKEGSLKNAKGEVPGAEVCCESSLDEGISQYLGTFSLKAKTVDGDKVPEDARTLLDEFVPLEAEAAESAISHD